jgi:hypothetical protein
MCKALQLSAGGCLFTLILPARLYRLFPCSFTAWLALRSLCDEPTDAAHEQILLNWR